MATTYQTRALYCRECGEHYRPNTASAERHVAHDRPGVPITPELRAITGLLEREVREVMLDGGFSRLFGVQEVMVSHQGEFTQAQEDAIGRELERRIPFFIDEA